MAHRERRRRARRGRRDGRLGEDGRERHAPHEQLSERRAHEARNTSGRETPGSTGRAAADGVLVQVCEVCGKEYFFDDEEPPADLTCEKCGNAVFRSFFDVAGYDEVEDDFRRSTERDLAPNDDESDVTRADVLDLNNP